ncbi:hypothetical protein P20652_0276 [Pseudoalteromonas sp. BSi20652]|uniref:polysaccharide lyase family 7 protein n=1 Tax=Pseudoalteromonas sp. BSi20652 TaxID=388384 RepID=UPI000231B010|nr:polysaccharide lyase family 7 protein [Pseudoalteromonas sp. BSi20652]GAA58422.1 hypothetical protein P20652_0276 [Pseudoalteromonas sp. BSi20652]
MQQTYITPIIKASAVTIALLSFSPSNAIASCNYSGNAPSGSYAPGNVSGNQRTEVRKAKLQVGPSSTTCYTQSTIKNSSSKNDHFYTTSDGSVIYFYESGESNRSELREEREFKISENTSSSRYIRINSKFVSKSSNLEKAIFAQVHVDESGQKGPLAALKWAAAGEQKDAYNKSPEGIYLSLRRTMNCSGTDCFTHIYVGNYDETFKTYRLGLFNGKLRLKVNNSYINLPRIDIYDEDGDGNRTEVKTGSAIDLRNNSDWKDKKLYLKTGVYINSAGNAKVATKNLKFY